MYFDYEPKVWEMVCSYLSSFFPSKIQTPLQIQEAKCGPDQRKQPYDHLPQRGCSSTHAGQELGHQWGMSALGFSSDSLVQLVSDNSHIKQE